MSLFFLIGMAVSFIPAALYSAYSLSPSGRLRSRMRRQQNHTARLTKTTEKTIQNARLEFQIHSERFIKNYRTHIGDSLPIESLKSFGAENVRWTALRNNGYKTVGDFIRNPAVTEISGVGTHSAQSLEKALTDARIAINAMEIPEPKQNDVHEGHGLLIAAQNQIESIQRSERLARHLAELDSISAEVAPSNFRDWLHNRTKTNTRAKKETELIAPLERSLEQVEEDLQQDSQVIRPELHEQVLEIIAEIVPGGTAARALFGALTSAELNSVKNFSLETDGLDVELRRYQIFGAKFCLLKKRILLGDEMGLGKTIQALAVMNHLRTQDLKHFLVLAPAGVVFNWTHEITQRTQLTAFAFTGSQRDTILETWKEVGGVLVASYSSARSNQLEKKVETVDLFVADEAHYTKNPSSGRAKTTRGLSGISEYVMFMSGTPIENRASEFVNIIEPINPDLATKLRGEKENLGREVAVQAASSLVLGRPTARLILILMKELHQSKFDDLVSPQEFRHLVRNTYLRRNQVDVLAELPECIETQSWTEMTPNDLKAYKAEVKNRNFMGMRRVCATEGKLELLASLVAECQMLGRKVVIFSYFLENLDLIEAYLPNVVARLDGSVATHERLDVIENFRSTPGHAIMVAQIVAAGIGINLQFASTVVLFEPQIKPSIEEQAIGRVKRMGQEQRVIVHRLLCANSVDERMLELMADKRQDFDDYARDSLAKENTDPFDGGQVNRILNEEARRLGLTVADALLDLL